VDFYYLGIKKKKEKKEINRSNAALDISV